MSDHDHPHDHPHDHEHGGEPRWKHDGVRVISGDRLDPNTAQTPGMFRQAAINHARVGAQKIWAGTVSIQPNAKTGVHHHGELESVIYVVRGKARMRWGERLEFLECDDIEWLLFHHREELPDCPKDLLYYPQCYCFLRADHAGESTG